MPKDQTKSLIINIVTGAVILGVLVIGYLAFSKQGKTPSTIIPTAASLVSQTASKTATMGDEVEATISDLDDLQRAVIGAAVVFRTPAFTSLQDFSVAVPLEKVGNQNPFVPTDWKLKILSLVGSVSENVPASSSDVQINVVANTSSSTPSSLPDVPSLGV